MKLNALILGMALLLGLAAFSSSCRKADNPTLPGDPTPTPSGCSGRYPVPVAVNAVGVTFDTRDKTDYSNSFNDPCLTSNGAPDDVYAFTLGTGTRVEITHSGTGWTPVVYVRKGSCDAASLFCLKPAGLHQMDLTAGTYYLIVDGDTASDKGDYSLAFRDATP